MRRRTFVRLATPLLAVFVLTGCVDELADLFEIIAFEESDDPELANTGKALREAREEGEVRELVDRFVETGDPRFLTDAKAVRPDDTEVRAMEVVLAMQGGDPDEIFAARQALALAEARRLQGIDDNLADLTGQPQPASSAEMLHRNVLGEILVAQTRLLGGSLTAPWDPPGPDAPPTTQQLFNDYCATRNTIMTEFDDNLSYIPLPPCPG